MTAAAVVVRAREADDVRALASALPKWRDTDESAANRAIELLAKHAVAVGVSSMTKDSPAWHAFFVDAKPLQAAIVTQDRSPAGFVKPSNVATFALLGHAYAFATAHAIKIDRETHIVDIFGRDLIERTIVCDTDIKGEENLEAFRALWSKSDEHQPAMKSLGLRLLTKEVLVAAEEDEPLIRLADLAAGLAHCSLIANPGTIRMPLAHATAKRLMDRLRMIGKLLIDSKPFDITYQEIFGEAFLKAAAESGGRLSGLPDTPPA